MDKVENFDFLRWLVERGGREGKERGYEKSNFDKLVAEVQEGTEEDAKNMVQVLNRVEYTEIDFFFESCRLQVKDLGKRRSATPSGNTYSRAQVPPTIHKKMNIFF